MENELGAFARYVGDKLGDDKGRIIENLLTNLEILHDGYDDTKIVTMLYSPEVDHDTAAYSLYTTILSDAINALRIFGIEFTEPTDHTIIYITNLLASLETGGVIHDQQYGDDNIEVLCNLVQDTYGVDKYTFIDELYKVHGYVLTMLRNDEVVDEFKPNDKRTALITKTFGKSVISSLTKPKHNLPLAYYFELIGGYISSTPEQRVIDCASLAMLAGVQPEDAIPFLIKLGGSSTEETTLRNLSWK
jgi:hypothetical protein